eukprot:9177484-Alexandrium_andersonii.AAC.1
MVTTKRAGGRAGGASRGGSGGGRSPPGKAQGCLTFAYGTVCPCDVEIPERGAQLLRLKAVFGPPCEGA